MKNKEMITEVANRQFQVDGEFVENLILKMCNCYRKHNISLFDESVCIEDKMYLSIYELEKGNAIMESLIYLLDIKIEILSLENGVIEAVIVDGEEFLV